MGKQIKWVNPKTGEEAFVDEYWFKLELPEPIRPSSAPPKELREFEDRLRKLYDLLYDSYFGIAHYVSRNKKISNDKSLENLIEIGIQCEKILNNRKCIIGRVCECYKFLKIALEKNYPFSDNAQAYLGVFIDRSGLTGPQKDEIAVQCAAQVIWNIEGERFPTIKAMIQRLRRKEDPLHSLLKLKDVSDDRTLRNWISPIYPVPHEERKKNPSKRAGFFNELIPIPGVRVDRRINFQKLQFVIVCITQVLKLLGWEEAQIADSKFISLLKEPLLFYPRMYLKDWVIEAYLGNGRIFDL